MSKNLTIIQFLDAVEYWNDHRKNLRDIPSADVSKSIFTFVLKRFNKKSLQ